MGRTKEAVQYLDSKAMGEVGEPFGEVEEYYGYLSGCLSWRSSVETCVPLPGQIVDPLRLLLHRQTDKSIKMYFGFCLSLDDEVCNILHIWSLLFPLMLLFVRNCNVTLVIQICGSKYR